MVPTAKNGKEKEAIFILNPSQPTINADAVVPILAPRMTPMAFCKLIIPAPKKAAIRKETRELDCSMAVVKVPDKTAFRGVPVKLRSIFLNDLPANPLMPFSRWYIPNNKRPRPAKNIQKSNGRFSISNSIFSVLI